MATSLTKDSTDYSGFINGYIAGNLAANATELHSHADRIIHFLNDLRNEISKWELSNEQEQEFQKLFASLSLDTPVSKYTEIDNYLKLGNGISDIIPFVYSIKPELPSMTNFDLKKIIYHFLNIAKTSKDSSLSSLAKNLTQKFEVGGN